MTHREPVIIPPDSLFEARLINARTLAEQLEPKRGGQAALAKALSRSPSQIAHIIGVRPTKRIGEELAREIEHSFNKPQYWLDQFHNDEHGDLPLTEDNTLEEIVRVNDRLSDLRLSWADLSRELGITNQRTYNWRQRGLPKTELVNIAQILHCSVTWLLTGETERDDHALNNEGVTTNQLLQKLAEAHQRIGYLEARNEQLMEQLALQKSTSEAKQ